MTDRTSVILCTSQLILFSFGLAQLSHALSGSLSSVSPALLDSQGVVQISAALQSGVSIDALLCAVWGSLLAGAAPTYLVRADDFFVVSRQQRTEQLRVWHALSHANFSCPSRAAPLPPPLLRHLSVASWQGAFTLSCALGHALSCSLALSLDPVIYQHSRSVILANLLAHLLELARLYTYSRGRKASPSETHHLMVYQSLQSQTSNQVLNQTQTPLENQDQTLLTTMLIKLYRTVASAILMACFLLFLAACIGSTSYLQYLHNRDAQLTAAATGDRRGNGDGGHSRPDEMGRRVDIGTAAHSHVLNLRCRKFLSPRFTEPLSVLLEAGLAYGSGSWEWYMEAFEEKMRGTGDDGGPTAGDKSGAPVSICSYDRSGYGWSDPLLGLKQLDVVLIAKQLHQLLLVAGTPSAQHVLVGWSFGGLVVEQFACMYPARVRAVILVDPSPPTSSRDEPGFPELWAEGVASFGLLAWLNPTGIVRGASLLGLFPPEAGLPAVDARSPRPPSLQAGLERTQHDLLAPHFAQTVRQELLGWFDSEQAVAECRRSGRSSGIPKVVISAYDTSPAMRQAQLGPPCVFREHLLATFGDHYIPYRDPEIIHSAFSKLFG